MAKARVKLNSAGVIDVFDQWAKGDGMARGERVAAAMNSSAPVESGALSRSHEAHVVKHSSGRSVVQIGSDLDYAAAIMVSTGYAARALDSA